MGLDILKWGAIEWVFQKIKASCQHNTKRAELMPPGFVCNSKL